MRVIIVCEFSGVVREAFRRRGHDAWSCDILPAEDGSPFHYQCDVRDIWGVDFDLWGFHPPCTYLNSAGLHWNNRGRGHHKTEEALEFVRFLMSKDRPWYLENPVGCISTKIRPYDQKIQPYEFGDDASKQTCLWLRDLPPLKVNPSIRVAGRMVKVGGKMVERWSNQTDSGQNKLAPSEKRWKDRSRTYPGIANAMASQWG